MVGSAMPLLNSKTVAPENKCKQTCEPFFLPNLIILNFLLAVWHCQYSVLSIFGCVLKSMVRVISLLEHHFDGSFVVFDLLGKTGSFSHKTPVPDPQTVVHSL
jgi:hypothetical protein